MSSEPPGEAEDAIVKINKSAAAKLARIKNNAGPETYVKLRKLIRGIDDALDKADPSHNGYAKLLEYRSTLDQMEKGYLRDEKGLFFNEIQESGETDPVRIFVLLISPASMQKRSRHFFPASKEAQTAYTESGRSLVRRLLAKTGINSVENERILHEEGAQNRVDNILKRVENTTFAADMATYFAKLKKKRLTKPRINRAESITVNRATKGGFLKGLANSVVGFFEKFGSKTVQTTTTMGPMTIGPMTISPTINIGRRPQRSTR